MPTLEEIARQTDHLNGRANTSAINKIFRKNMVSARRNNGVTTNPPTSAQ